MTDFYISFGWRQAGLISFGWMVKDKHTNIHILPAYSHWHWGYSTEWCQGCLTYFGLGPLILFAWFE